MTIRDFIKTLEGHAKNLGDDAPIALWGEDEYYGERLDEPWIAVKTIRVEGRGAPAFAPKKTRHAVREGLVIGCPGT